MTRNNATEKRGQAVYMLLKAAQRRFGMARFEIGVLLSEIKDSKLWEGRANSFASFLEEERINSSAAYSYMRVTRKLFYELELSDREFERIATVNMGTLDLAAQVLSKDNVSDILPILEVLGERDARQELLERIDATGAAIPSDQDMPKAKPRGKQAQRLLSAFYDMPDDQRLEFLGAIQRKPSAHGTEQA